MVMRNVCRGLEQHDDEFLRSLNAGFLFLFCWIQSLLLLAYLVRNGSERVVTSAREHIHDLRSLEHYTCDDECGKDQGVNGMCVLLLTFRILFVSCICLLWCEWCWVFVNRFQRLKNLLFNNLNDIMSLKFGYSISVNRFILEMPWAPGIFNSN